MDPRDRGVIMNLTDAVNKLTKAIKPDSFHNRQVPALKRQTEALEYLRKQRELCINVPLVSQDTILHTIDKVTEILLST